jgi:hypothetical protein
MHDPQRRIACVFGYALWHLAIDELTLTSMNSAIVECVATCVERVRLMLSLEWLGPFGVEISSQYLHLYYLSRILLSHAKNASYSNTETNTI